jgi:hypothetical protein
MKTFNAQLHLSNEILQNRKVKLPILSILKTVGQLFMPVFASSNEPRIWTTTDCHGNTSWHAYDPVSGARASLGSEAEMRTWIEQRYYN